MRYILVEGNDILEASGIFHRPLLLGEGWGRAVKQSLIPNPSPKREKGERQLGFHFT